MRAPEPVTLSGGPVPLPSHGHLEGAHPAIFGTKGHPMAVVWIRNHMNLPLHSHDFVELVLILAGTAEHLLPEGAAEIAAGNVFVIKPGTPHGYRRTQGLELVNVLFASRELPVSLDDLSPLPGFRALFDLQPGAPPEGRLRQGCLFVGPPLRRELAGLAGRLAEELRCRQPGYRSMSASLLARMIVLLSRDCACPALPGPQALPHVNRAAAYIESHFERPIRLDELALQAGTCARSLQRHFLRAFGASPIEYMNRLRVHRAEELLLATDLNVTQIAGAVGIEDSNYFSRLFHRVAGLTPSDFRQSGGRLPPPPTPSEAPCNHKAAPAVPSAT